MLGPVPPPSCTSPAQCFGRGQTQWAPTQSPKTRASQKVSKRRMFAAQASNLCSANFQSSNVCNANFQSMNLCNANYQCLQQTARDITNFCIANIRPRTPPSNFWGCPDSAPAIFRFVQATCGRLTWSRRVNKTGSPTTGCRGFWVPWKISFLASNSGFLTLNNSF